MGMVHALGPHCKPEITFQPGNLFSECFNKRCENEYFISSRERISKFRIPKNYCVKTQAGSNQPLVRRGLSELSIQNDNNDDESDNLGSTRELVKHVLCTPSTSITFVILESTHSKNEILVPFVQFLYASSVDAKNRQNTKGQPPYAVIYQLQPHPPEY